MATANLNLRPTFFSGGSVEVEPAKPGEGGIRRLAVTAGKLMTQPAPDVATVPDILSYAAKKYKDMNAVGWRDVLDVHEEKKPVKKVVDGREVTEEKTWSYFELSEYRYWSYVELLAAVEEVARALVALGISTDDVFNIYAQTGLNWQLMSHACSLISTPIATAYDSLGKAGLTHSLNEPSCAGVFANGDLLRTLLAVLPNTPSVRFVIYDGTPPDSVLADLRKVREGLQILSVADLRAQGASAPPLDGTRRPTPSTLACIMYTSGSTGPPKGVCLSHLNLLASIGSISYVFAPHLPAGDTYLAYLPLAHVLEYIVELAAMFVGITIGFARPKTLTDASVRKCKGDLRAFRPNIMFGVPTVWETIRKGIIGELEKQGRLVQGAFWIAMGLKKRKVPLLAWAADSLVLARVREATGGRLKYAMNGGASISKDTQEFLSLAVMPMMQGYGMTESCGMCTLLPPELLSYGPVGLPTPSVEIKLRDVPDAGYLSSNDPPEGEICIRGPSVTGGYFKRDDLNNDEEVFMQGEGGGEGGGGGGKWLRTGDVGRWNKNGTLSLVDRLKNLVKLQGGEYIALEHLESIYKSCDLVSNLCVHASAEAKQPIAIIVPRESNLRRALAGSSSKPPSPANGSANKNTPANSDDLSSMSFPDLCHHPAAKQAVLSACLALAKKNGFRQPEMLCGVVLSPTEWTPESGLVTPAQKLNRGAIARGFKAEVEEAYKGK